MKKCPFCAEEIQDAAIKCRYCHSDLASVDLGPARSGGSPAPSTGSNLPAPFSARRGSKVGCPYCAKTVTVGDDACAHCGHGLPGPPSSPAVRSTLVYVVLGVVGVIVGLIILGVILQVAGVTPKQQAAPAASESAAGPATTTPESTGDKGEPNGASAEAYTFLADQKEKSAALTSQAVALVQADQMSSAGKLYERRLAEIESLLSEIESSPGRYGAERDAVLRALRSDRDSTKAVLAKCRELYQ